MPSSNKCCVKCHIVGQKTQSVELPLLPWEPETTDLGLLWQCYGTPCRTYSSHLLLGHVSDAHCDLHEQDDHLRDLHCAECRY